MGLGSDRYLPRANDGWLQPEVQYAYDLIVPRGDDAPIPKPSDGEVELFEVGRNHNPPQTRA